MSDAYLVDTNVLLRFVKPDDRDHALVWSSLGALLGTGARLCYTTQNFGEFWNVCTRPASHNGFGLSVAEANRRTQLIESQFTLLVEDPKKLYEEWRRLLLMYSVCGTAVHEARLVAAMRVARMSRLITFNVQDFKRFDGVSSIHPKSIAGNRYIT